MAENEFGKVEDGKTAVLTTLGADVDAGDLAVFDVAQERLCRDRQTRRRLNGGQQALIVPRDQHPRFSVFRAAADSCTIPITRSSPTYFSSHRCSIGHNSRECAQIFFLSTPKLCSSNNVKHNSISLLLTIVKGEVFYCKNAVIFSETESLIKSNSRLQSTITSALFACHGRKINFS
ncbi:hypothetical protein J2W92_002704 [Rhizobium leguminosarum]